LLIQASAKIDRAAYADYIAAGVELPPAEELLTGAIIGSVQVTGCVRDSRSRWAEPGYWQSTPNRSGRAQRARTESSARPGGCLLATPHLAIL